ncbi:MMPL family transporter [Streptomyces sp. DSM 42041]|uniref:MMPL family transporter n=1 Tax=Streptomyces hazeniae TaxID=3075538 RepID=A0ABU2NNX2_9ACTN|nr:MMPL family transporter [Streptomyces sp. DSM 42041]MDT0378674.1 MMPL family transporter [Streptomyces sp. DSM 42041]
MAALARWCLRRRLVVAALWLLALAGTAAAVTAVGTAYTSDYGVSGTESSRAQDLLRQGFPDTAGESDTVVWHVPADRDGGGVREPAVRERMGQALRQIADVPTVSGVTSPYAENPRADDRISRDGETAYATVHFDPAVEEVPQADTARVADLAAAAAEDVPGLRTAVGGANVPEADTGSTRLSEAIGVAAAAVVLLFAFGSLAAMLLPLITAVVSVGTAYLVTGLLGHVMTLADFAPMLGTLIGLGVGIDYALFIVTRHRRGLRRGLTVAEAAEDAVSSAGRAVIFAGATVCIALLGMLVLRLDFLVGVAVAASVTVLLAVLASITLLPSLLSVIGVRALSRRERRRLAWSGPAAEEGTAGPAARWSAFVERRPRVLGALAAALMVVLALPVLGLHLGTADGGTAPAGSPTRQAYDLRADGFGPGINGPLTLVAEIDGPEDRSALERLPGALRDAQGVAGVTGPAVSERGGVGTVTVLPDSAPQDVRTSQLVERLRADVLPRALDGAPLTVHVGGLTASYDDFADTILEKLPLFLGVVVALGSALLLLAFRSIGIPVKAALMNVLAVSASFGVVVAVFQWGWGSEAMGLGGAGPIEPFLPVIMISVLFGLSMDYQVFLVSRMYEEWRRTGDNRRSVRVGLAETGRVINCAAAIMIAVFSAFVLSGDRIIAMFGIGLATAVALDAYVLRTLLVPALMHLLGGANWWLPKWLDRILPRVTIEPPERPQAVEPGADEPAFVPHQRDGDRVSSG